MGFNFISSNAINWIKRQKYHIVFISSLLALTLLVTWWAVFLYNSVNDIYNTKMDSIKDGINSYSLFLGHNKLNKPVIGKFSTDTRFEIIDKKENFNSFAKELTPKWENYWIQPERNYIESLASDLKSKRFMVLGESGFLLLLILVSGLMIYRMYFLEKRTTLELHELWSRVTHEIKTPITGIKAFLQTLQKGTLKPEEIKPLLEMALKQINRQNQLSENMLIGQKLKRRASGIKMVPVNLRDYLISYLNSDTFQTYKNKIQFIDRTDETEALTVLADLEALNTIFDNLIDNARKYGGPEVVIKIILYSQKKKTFITVKDNGPGFDPKMAGTIFNAYKRIGNELPEKTKNGTGMGLYISQRLAKKMSSSIVAVSDGNGAEFTLTLRKSK